MIVRKIETTYFKSDVEHSNISITLFRELTTTSESFSDFGNSKNDHFLNKNTSRLLYVQRYYSRTFPDMLSCILIMWFPRDQYHQDIYSHSMCNLYLYWVTLNETYIFITGYNHIKSSQLADVFITRIIHKLRKVKNQCLKRWKPDKLCPILI